MNCVPAILQLDTIVFARLRFVTMTGLCVWGLQAVGASQCRYFLVAHEMSRCRIAKEHDSASSYDTGDGLPVDPAAGGMAVKVDCLCSYTSKGDNPLCDLEKTDRQSTFLPTDTPKITCQSRHLCDNVCSIEE